MGQLTTMLRAEYLVDVRALTQVRGLPFTASTLSDAIHEALHELDPRHTPAPATPKEERA